MRILVCDPIAEAGITLLRQHAEVDVRTGLRPEQLAEIVGDYAALVVRSETKVTARIIESASQLQVIGRAGIGIDNIDLDAATRKGVVVVNAPTATVIAAAEHTIALLTALARHIPQADASLRAGEWKRSRFVGVEIRGKVLGIIGLGRIGVEVARRAQGLQMQVVAHDPFVAPEIAERLNIRLTSFAELLQTADFITVHTPLTGGTRGLIGAEELTLVKPTARLINCARGGIIDEQALLEALDNDQLAGAALDVFNEEPPRNDRLITHEKVVVTPHLGASTTEAQVGVAVDVAEQVIAALRGEPVAYAVNAPTLPPETMGKLAPYLRLAERLGSLLAQLTEGQINPLEVNFAGEIAAGDTTPLRAAVLRGVLQHIVEERVTLLNAGLLAKNRGLHLIERRQEEAGEHYTNLITVRAPHATGLVKEVAGTVAQGEPHVVRIDCYWVDLVPGVGYWLFSTHGDRPGIIGQVGTLLGNYDINISFMQVGRTTPRGQAMMVLGVDDPIPDHVHRRLLAIKDVGTAKIVRL